MTDTRVGVSPAGAPAAAGGYGLLGFAREARHGIMRREIVLPACLLLVALTASNIALLLNAPAPGERPGLAVALAGLARVAGLFIFSIPILRIAAGSPRRPWRPDGAFFLFLLAVLINLVVGVTLAALIGDPENPDAASTVIRSVAATAILAPLAPWTVAIVAAVPLGWNPRRFLWRFGEWLPHLLFWSLLLATPLATIHALVDAALLLGQIDWFWTVALLDGLLSTALLLLVYALNAAAYRRVARG